MRTSDIEYYKKALDEIAHIIETDIDGNITYVNDKVCELTKYTREELIGRNNRIFKTGYHNEDFYNKMYKELTEGKIFKARFRNKAKDGTFFWLDATIIPFMDDNNQPYKYLTVRFDITEKINAIEQKELFLANITHDIRTPLHGILGIIDILKTTPLNDEQHEHLQQLELASEHIKNIVNDLLDLFKLEAGKLRIENVPFDVKSETNALLDIFITKGKLKNIHVSGTFDNKIKSSLYGDPTRLKQILYNLLDNALKYTAQGSISLKVNVTDENEHLQILKFKVSDTGKGIPMEKQNEIFEFFAQSNINDTRLYGGSGLGLSIVKNLITLQQGSLHLESEPGMGTTFSFTLPFLKQNNNHSNSNKKPIPVKSNYYKNKHILIADDDKLNRMIYQKQMEKLGINFTIVEEGVDVFKQLNNVKSDLLILDMQMPDINGDEILLKLRKDYPAPICNTPAIIISATTQLTIAEKLKHTDHFFILTKPYKEADLFKLINEILQHNTSEQKQKIKRDNKIDLSYLQEFAEGDLYFITELLMQFEQDAPELLKELEENLLSNKKKVAGLLHKYRSQLTLLGLTHLALQTEEAEHLIFADHGFHYSNVVKDIIHQSQSVIQQIPDLIKYLNNTNEY